MIRKAIVIAALLFVGYGIQKVHASGEPLVYTSSAVTTTGSIWVTNTTASNIQLQNLGTSGTVTYVLNGTSDTFRDSVSLPILPFITPKLFEIKIVSLPAGSTVQVRVFGATK